MGNIEMARQVFEYVMAAPSIRHGPVFLEATRFEERIGQQARAVELASKGLARVPHYGPLWFAAFRIYERVEAGEDQWPRVVTLPQTRRALASAVKELPPELRWKVHFIAAQTEERAASAAGRRVGVVKSVRFAPGEPAFPVQAVVVQCLKKSRERLMNSMLQCPKNLKWKPRLAGARMELRAGKTKQARKLLEHALKEAPQKAKAQVLVECTAGRGLWEPGGRRGASESMANRSTPLCTFARQNSP